MFILHCLTGRRGQLYENFHGKAKSFNNGASDQMHHPNLCSTKRTSCSASSPISPFAQGHIFSQSRNIPTGLDTGLLLVRYLTNFHCKSSFRCPTNPQILRRCGHTVGRALHSLHSHCILHLHLHLHYMMHALHFPSGTLLFRCSFIYLSLYRACNKYLYCTCLVRACLCLSLIYTCDCLMSRS